MADRRSRRQGNAEDPAAAAPPWAGLTLDRFQRRALDCLDAGLSVLVSAPTGSGKTLVAEHAIDRALAAGRRAFYTTPIKALSNQKYRDFAARLGRGRVGLLTGDNAVNGEAEVVVMTTEVLRNMLYADSVDERLGVVVLDEIHFLADAYRGAVWEEVVLNLAEGVTLVCLSATVSNHRELGGWLHRVRGSTAVVAETRRPVPLTNLYAVSRRRGHELHLVDTLVDGRPNAAARRFDAPLGAGRGRQRRRPPGRGHQRRRGRGRGRGRGLPWRAPRRDRLLDELRDRDLLPAIWFVFSRKGCDQAAARLARHGAGYADEADAARIDAIVEAGLAGLRRADREALGAEQWAGVLRRGIAAHHAGMVPVFKEAVERCFTAGLIKVVFATETLALGVNMPARSVIIDKLVKYDGSRMAPLTPAQYTQFTGRAGRRGIDTAGHAIVLWSPDAAFGDVAALAASRSFRLRSAFRPNYNMVAGLLARMAPEAARDLLGRSFAQYQAHRRDNRGRRQHSETPGDNADHDAAEKGRGGRGRRQHSETPHPHGGTSDGPARRGGRGRRQHSEPVGAAPGSRAGEHRGGENARSPEGGEPVDLARQFNAVAAVLRERGHLDGWRPTRSGRLVARIYHEADLAIAESVAAGLFDGLSAPALASVLSAFVYEHRSPGPPPDVWIPSKAAYRHLGRIARRVEGLNRSERRHGVPPTRAVDTGFAAMAHYWAAGTHFDRLIGDAADGRRPGPVLTGGEFVRNVKQVVDLARQLAAVSPVRATAAAALQAAERLNRGVVAISGALEDIDFDADHDTDLYSHFGPVPDAAGAVGGSADPDASVGPGPGGDFRNDPYEDTTAEQSVGQRHRVLPAAPKDNSYEDTAADRRAPS